MTRLQPVQNAAARNVSGARRYDHVTPVLHQLHWLPVRKRAGGLKDGHLGLRYRSLSDMALAYLVSWCLKKVVRLSAVCSADSSTCVVGGPTTTFGDRYFATALPKL